jgi:hypothetical protein
MRAAAQHPSAFLLSCAAFAISVSVLLHDIDPLHLRTTAHRPKTKNLPHLARSERKKAQSPTTVYKIKFGRFPFDLEASRVMTSGQTVTIAPMHAITLAKSKTAGLATQTRHAAADAPQQPATGPTATPPRARGL